MTNDQDYQDENPDVQFQVSCICGQSLKIEKHYQDFMVEDQPVKMVVHPCLDCLSSALEAGLDMGARNDNCGVRNAN